jgi:hypothetical protein
VITSTANALDVAAAWADNAAASFTPGRTTTGIAAAATTTVVAAPAATVTRNVSNLSFFARGGANTIQVQTTGGTTVQYNSIALASGEKLEYENGRGWNVFDATGQLKQSIAAGAGSIPLTALATQAANTELGNWTAGVASPTANAVGTNTVVGRVAGNIVAASLVNAQITANTITHASEAQPAANTIVGNPTAGAANLTDIAFAVQSVTIRAAANIVNVAATAGQELRRTLAGGDLGFSVPEIGATLGAAITANAAATNATTNLSCTGSQTLPANSSSVGSTLKAEGWYSYLHTAAATPTLTAELVVNAAVVATAILTPVSAAATFAGTVQAVLTIRTTGAGGTAIAQVQFVETHAAVNSVDGSVVTATFAIDTTVARTVELRIRMTTAVASNTLTVTNGFIVRYS